MAPTRTHEQDRTLWSIEDAAAYLQLPIKTLYQWRSKEYGPPSHRVGRHVRYIPDEVRTWVKGQD